MKRLGLAVIACVLLAGLVVRAQITNQLTFAVSQILCAAGTVMQGGTPSTCTANPSIASLTLSGALTSGSVSSGTGSFTSVSTSGNGIAINGTGKLFLANNVAISGVAPTISSGFGSSPSIVASNGTLGFQINVGTGGAASSGVIGLPAATTGWICQVNDLTASLANVAGQQDRQTASSTTTATIQHQTNSTGAALVWTASDILNVSCAGY